MPCFNALSQSDLSQVECSYLLPALYPLRFGPLRSPYTQIEALSVCSDTRLQPVRELPVTQGEHSELDEGEQTLGAQRVSVVLHGCLEVFAVDKPRLTSQFLGSGVGLPRSHASEEGLEVLF